MNPVGELRWRDYEDRRKYQDNFELTGRIKYTKHASGHVGLHLEVRVTEVTKHIPEHTTGFFWWKKIVPTQHEEFKRKMWVSEDSFHYSIPPQETIYECTATSTPHGDSCSENHW